MLVPDQIKRLRKKLLRLWYKVLLFSASVLKSKLYRPENFRNYLTMNLKRKENLPSKLNVKK